MSTARTLMAIATDIWNVLPHWARWVTGTLLVLWLGWAWLFQERYGGASVIVMSVMDRPISYASVNGNGGGNTFAFDGLDAGGKTAGPYSITGDTARIDWELDMTLAQEQAGYQFEKYSMTLPMPKREKGQDDFCILFLPDNKPLIRWATSCSIDMNAVIKKYRTRG
ncbi:hypothetical protein [Siccibacter turicensis]|uniref:DUF3304 domain-containing protein n=1 Tax=Siccibacter turicensis TaxID=357233 RepID=A0A2P8VE99_9ENTR|nr:hypothetical protein [Siccibacter turicensis]PSN05851.1 hypothetical protein C7G83_19855 [Siccibacter turicensis]